MWKNKFMASFKFHVHTENLEMHHFVYRHVLTNNNGHKQRSNLKSKLVHIARLAPSAKRKTFETKIQYKYRLCFNF